MQNGCGSNEKFLIRVYPCASVAIDSPIPVLDFRISASYGGTEVLRDVACHIRSGEIVALVGLSGSGKSTMALSLLRLLRYRGGEAAGTILLEGNELIGKSDKEMRAVLGMRMGYVPQSPAAALNERLRVETLLEETWKAHSRTAPPAGFFNRLLESVQLRSGHCVVGSNSTLAEDLAAAVG